MHKRLGLSLILVAVGVVLSVLVTASTTQAAQSAAPKSAQASFGVLMKPGWGGAGDVAGVNAGSVYVLRCVYMKGRLPRLSSATTLTQTRVITTWGFVEPNGSALSVNCAAYTGPNLGGQPLPDGYVAPR